MTHEQLIAKCTQWFWNEFPEERRMLYAINNNISEGLMKYVPLHLRAQVAREIGAKNKALGVVAGVLDLCYICFTGQVVYLDAKVGNDRLSDEQLDFIDKLNSRGIMWFTFSTFEEFQQIIKQLRDG